MRKIVFFIICNLLYQCARQSQPTGGPKDTAPPELISSNPTDGQKNFIGETIDLTFDEPVKLKDPKEEILIAPSTGSKTKFAVKKNKVIITPELEWKDSTTYSLAFRNGIQDLNEGNPAEDLHLAFSTGPTIDSLRLNGYITEAFKEKIPEKITIALYQEDTFDIFKHKPIYFTKTNKKGHFSMRNLKAGVYFIYAFDDKSKNMKVDSKSEMFGFIARPIHLPDDTDSIHLQLVHLDSRPIKITSVRNSTTVSTIRFNKPLDSVKLTSAKKITYTYGDTRSEIVVYKNFDKDDSLMVRVIATDSVNQKIDSTVYVKYTDTKKIAEKFKLDEWQIAFDPLTNIMKAETHSNKLLLSQNYDSIYIQIDTSNYQLITPKEITFDTLSKKLIIQTTLKINPKEKIPNPVLLFGKAAFITIDNDSSKSQDVKIRIPKAEETGSIAVEINTKDAHFEVQLLTSDFKLIKSFRDLKKYTFTYLKPAEYRITIVVDSNNNNRWEPGDFHRRKEPETIFLYQNLEKKYTIPVRANWEIGPLLISF
jgi:uncharacterized protein (DUF2141 family)